MVTGAGHAMVAQHTVEEPASRGAVAAGRDQDFDHLAVLVNGHADVTPDAGDADASLVDQPSAADGVAARAGGVDQLPIASAGPTRRS